MTIHPGLVASSPLRPELLAGVDLLIVRELTGGIYFGERQEATGAGRRARGASTRCRTPRPRSGASSRLGFELARARRGRLTSVDKANVLATSRLWRQVVEEEKPGFPDVEVNHQLVDSCAMLLVKSPAWFDVIVTENLFGDILSDEASVLAGSLGMLPSASLGERKTEHGTFGLYEPIHGSAPDIAGRDIANPVGTILSAAMLARWSLGREDVAAAIESGGRRRARRRAADGRPGGRRRPTDSASDDRDDRGDRGADRDYGGCAGNRRSPHVIETTATARRTPDR